MDSLVFAMVLPGNGVHAPGEACPLPCDQLSLQAHAMHAYHLFATSPFPQVAVQYQVNPDTDSIKDAMYKLTNARAQIESYVYDGEPGFPCPQFARLICLRKQLMMVASAPRREQLCGQQCPRLSLTMCSRQRTRSLAQSSHN
eukprot:scaffold275023_cov35-Tisochrysis_lutea.AAC.2